MDRAGERKRLDERIYAALSYANVHPDKVGLNKAVRFSLIN